MLRSIQQARRGAISREQLHRCMVRGYRRCTNSDWKDQSRAKSRPPSPRPRALKATGPLQVFSWDITYLPSRVRGQYFYLYLVVDVWSRRIMAAEVHDRECGNIAAVMIEKYLHSAAKDGKRPSLHADNGGLMRSATLLVKLHDLGISPSFSRPRVSNDNAYSEALFRTLKYRPSFPSRPFADLAAAQQWVDRFVCWYNTQHIHSAVRFVTPDARHFGLDTAQLAKRRAVYEAARAEHPERWSRGTRDWSPIFIVNLNPERDSERSKQLKNAA